MRTLRSISVAPHAGAWIETSTPRTGGLTSRPSHPTRVRGLKPATAGSAPLPPPVAPHAGAWIETLNTTANDTMIDVAPHAGAWIETWPKRKPVLGKGVAPHAGAWIETLN